MHTGATSEYFQVLVGDDAQILGAKHLRCTLLLESGKYVFIIINKILVVRLEWLNKKLRSSFLLNEEFLRRRTPYVRNL